MNILLRVPRFLFSKIFKFLGSEPVSSPKWEVVTAGPLKGSKLFLDVTAASWQQEMRDGRFEPFILDELSRFVDFRGLTVWDVGGHVGFHSLLFAALVGPAGRVISFEPSAQNLTRLRANLDGNSDLASRVTVLDSALGRTDGIAQMRVHPSVDRGHSSGNALNEVVEANETDDRQLVEVTIRAGDSLARSGIVPAPDILKIDVEGAEAMVLEGMVSLLATHQPVLAIEIHGVTAMFKTLQLLMPMGYSLQIIHPEGASEGRCHILGAVSGPEAQT